MNPLKEQQLKAFDKVYGNTAVSKSSSSRPAKRVSVAQTVSATYNK